jgi:hypothetical protein
MIWVVLLFVPPLFVGSTMLCPQGLGYTINAVVGYAGIMLLLLPFAAWPLFLIQIAAPLPGQTRVQAVISTWFGGAALVSAVMNFLGAALGYSPNPLHVDPTGHQLIPYDPQTGVLLGGFALCMLLSLGCWGVLARVLPGAFVLRGALVTGLLLFGAVAGLGYILWPQQSPVNMDDPATRLFFEQVRPGVSR